MEQNKSGVAIVTGAGSGIGLEVARQLSAAGWSVMLTGRTRSKLDAVGKGLRGRWTAVEGDIGEEGFVKRLVARTLEEYGGFDAVVNSAGVAYMKPIPDHTPAMINEEFRTNAIGPAMLMAAAWPHLKARGGGCIVNVSSMASIDPYDGYFGYAATKAAMNMLTRIGADEGQEAKIRCYCVAPGAVETPMLRSMFSTKDIPLGAPLDAADVARVIVECVREDRSPGTGEPIVVRR